jgi:uracil-DNA glycosylase
MLVALFTVCDAELDSETEALSLLVDAELDAEAELLASSLAEDVDSDAELEESAELEDADELPELLEVCELSLDAQGMVTLLRLPENNPHAIRPKIAATTRTTTYGTTLTASERGPRWTPTGPAGGLSNSSGVYVSGASPALRCCVITSPHSATHECNGISGQLRASQCAHCLCPLHSSAHTTVESMTETSGTHRKALSELIDPGWAQALSGVEDDIHRMGSFLREEHAHGRQYLPASKNILRAFTIPFDDIKVLIVGQDPYPTPGHPVGLSFCVDPAVSPLPGSLRNIFKELVDDLHVPQPINGDLTPWTRQGVMLLNRCLTVAVGAPGSHRGKGWEVITDAAITALNERTDSQGRPKTLVAILWGRQAQSLAPLLTNATIITSPHPSPLSARSGFFGSRPFSKANAALLSQGSQAVDWSLPSALG